MENMIWNKNKECMSREELRDLQGKRLHKLVDLVYHNTPFYRAKMQEMDLLPDDIRTIDDIVKLPFTTKADLRDNYPVGLLATPMSEIVRIHASSGTTGNPTIVGYTYRDLEIWKEVIARALTAYGMTRGDIVSVGYGYGLFTGRTGCPLRCGASGGYRIAYFYREYGETYPSVERPWSDGYCLYAFLCPVSG